MCGIAGIVRAGPARPVDEVALRGWPGALRHRGPDGFGLALDPGAGLVVHAAGHLRHPDGWQPMQPDAGGTLLVYNGEVFNHPELRAELARAGSTSRPPPTPRSCCACWSARASPRWTG